MDPPGAETSGKKCVGKKYPDTLLILNNLAAVLSDQGTYEQAEEMHREARYCSTLAAKDLPYYELGTLKCTVGWAASKRLAMHTYKPIRN